MRFEDLRYSEICGVVRHVTKVRSWNSANNSHIIGIKLSGSAWHDFDCKKFVMDEGCVYFLNQNEPYRVDTDIYGESFSVHFTTPEPIETHSFCIKTENRSEILKCLEKIEVLFLQGKKNNEMSMHFYRLCSIFDEIRSKEYSPKREAIYDCRDYMDLYFREKDCLLVSAEKSGVTRRRFNDIFKSTFDITPARYINAKKTEYAKSLLLAADLSVTDIATMCGFSDVYYFSKVFKSDMGCTPTEFRKRHSVTAF